MATGAFIIARLSSSRLPGKCIMKILDRPMIELMAQRISKATLIDKLVITTSTHSSDDPLEELAMKIGVECYRGPLDNIMERISGAAQASGCDTVVELLGDNPLVPSELMDDTIALYREGNLDYAATITKEYPEFTSNKKLFSLGVRVQVYSKKAVDAYKEYREYVNNEEKHPCAYIFDNPEQFQVGFLEAKGKWSFMNRPELNFAVNYRKNFNLIRMFFETHYSGDQNFPLEKVYDQLDKQPYLYMLLGSE